LFILAQEEGWKESSSSSTCCKESRVEKGGKSFIWKETSQFWYW